MRIMRESVPFTIEMYEGLAQTDGLLRLEGENLVLEWQVKDAVFGVLKGGINRIVVPLEQVREVQARKRIWPFRWPLRIQVSDLRTLEAAPGTGSELRLLVSRRHGKVLLQLAGEIQLRLSEMRLRELDEEVRTSREARGAGAGLRPHETPPLPQPERRF